MFVEYYELMPGFWKYDPDYITTVEHGTPHHRSAVYQTPDLTEPSECVWIVPNTLDVEDY